MTENKMYPNPLNETLDFVINKIKTKQLDEKAKMLLDGMIYKCGLNCGIAMPPKEVDNIRENVVEVIRKRLIEIVESVKKEEN